MSRIKKAIWLSYDLGIGGDYPGLYKWLDNNKAKECGNSLAFLYYNIEREKTNELPRIVYDDIKNTVDLRAGDRLYLVYRDTNETIVRVKGVFLYGKRKSSPWEGYGDGGSPSIDDGE